MNNLLNKIISDANNGQTFSEEQIDYEYIMDQQVISAIRQYNKAHKNYTFEASTPEPQVSSETGVQYYESKFLDELEGLTLKDGTSVRTTRSQPRDSMRAKNYRASGTID